MPRFGLKDAIFRTGDTQRAFARKVEPPIRETRLSDIVRGWLDPTPEERHAIAAALGRNERGLFRNTEPAHPERHDAVA